MAAVSTAGELDSSSCGPTGVAVCSRNSSRGITEEMACSSSSSSKSSSMAVEIANISPSLLCSGNVISSICHVTCSVVLLIGSNAPFHRNSVPTNAEDQSLGLESRGTAGRTPRGTKKNSRFQLAHRSAPFTIVCDAEGLEIWPASVLPRGDLRGTAPLMERTVISVTFTLRYAGPSSPCRRMPTWSLRLAVEVAILLRITMTAAAGV